MSELRISRQMPCATECFFKKRCGEMYDEGQPGCVEEIQGVRRSFNNGAEAQLIQLIPSEVAIFQIDKNKPQNELAKYKGVAIVSEGNIYVPANKK